jgi:hypothetical protein
MHYRDLVIARLQILYERERLSREHGIENIFAGIIRRGVRFCLILKLNFGTAVPVLDVVGDHGLGPSDSVVVSARA